MNIKNYPMNYEEEMGIKNVERGKIKN